MRTALHHFGLIGLLTVCFLASGLLAWYDADEYSKQANKSNTEQHIRLLTFFQHNIKVAQEYHSYNTDTPTISIHWLAQEENRTEVKKIHFPESHTPTYWLAQYTHKNINRRLQTADLTSNTPYLLSTERYLLYGALLL